MNDESLAAFVEWARTNPWCTDPGTLRRVFTAYDNDEGYPDEDEEPRP